MLRERQENRAVLALKLQSLGVNVEPIEPTPSVVSIPNTQPVIEGGEVFEMIEHDSAVADTQNPHTLAISAYKRFVNYGQNKLN